MGLVPSSKKMMQQTVVPLPDFLIVYFSILQPSGNGWSNEQHYNLLTSKALVLNGAFLQSI